MIFAFGNCEDSLTQQRCNNMLMPKSLFFPLLRSSKSIHVSQVLQLLLCTPQKSLCHDSDVRQICCESKEKKYYCEKYQNHLGTKCRSLSKWSWFVFNCNKQQFQLCQIGNYNGNLRCFTMYLSIYPSLLLIAYCKLRETHTHTHASTQCVQCSFSVNWRSEWTAVCKARTVQRARISIDI